LFRWNRGLTNESELTNEVAGAGAMNNSFKAAVLELAIPLA